MPFPWQPRVFSLKTEIKPRDQFINGVMFNKSPKVSFRPSGKWLRSFDSDAGSVSFFRFIKTAFAIVYSSRLHFMFYSSEMMHGQAAPDTKGRGPRAPGVPAKIFVAVLYIFRRYRIFRVHFYRKPAFPGEASLSGSGHGVPCAVCARLTGR